MVTFPAAQQHRPLAIPNYTARWQRHTSVNESARAAGRTCNL